MTYTQPQKNRAREELLTHAVTILTEKRSQAPCVRTSYIRDLKRYFISEEETPNCVESSRIDNRYICEWEKMHRSTVGQKSPEDLKVCYLSGPEPMNDFKVLADLGVRPQNIWAFESSNQQFSEALTQCCGAGFDQPKLIKMKIEKFLESVPISFDIVYLDFCSSFISSRMSLRCVADVFRFHRLTSPGVLITNFCEADEKRICDYAEVFARYELAKQISKNHANKFGKDEFSKFIHTAEDELKKKADFDSCYSDFITDFICNMASVIIPAQKTVDPALISFLSDCPITDCAKTAESVVEAESDALLRFLLSCSGSLQNSPLNCNNTISQRLNNDLKGSSKHSALQGLQYCNALRTGLIPHKKEIDEIAKKFSATHRFLDKPCKSLYLDFAIRQLTYPMHSNPLSSIRLSYIAKSKRMFADAIVFDECRYVYDWFPAAMQGSAPLENVSWFYVFRFALDGLIKCRLETNTDYFFQGSVVGKTIEGFESSNFADRIFIS